jgi:hypothetical protein
MYFDMFYILWPSGQTASMEFENNIEVKKIINRAIYRSSLKDNDHYYLARWLNRFDKHVR